MSRSSALSISVLLLLIFDMQLIIGASFFKSQFFIIIWDEVFNSGLSEFCGRQSLRNLLSPLLNALSHMQHYHFPH